MDRIRSSLNWLAQYNKAIVPLVVLGILKVLDSFGISENMSVGEALTFVVTAGLVWLVPNRR